MNSDRIRQFIEVAGFTAVVASLLLVAYQILQSNRLAEASTLYEIVRDINQFNDMVLTNPSIADLLAALERPDFAPSATEERQAQALADRMLNVWVVQEVAYRNGLFDETQFAITRDDVIVAINDLPGLIPFWRKTLVGMPEFEEYVVLEPLLR